jgi:hypothetical protein
MPEKPATQPLALMKSQAARKSRFVSVTHGARNYEAGVDDERQRIRAAGIDFLQESGFLFSVVVSGWQGDHHFFAQPVRIAGPRCEQWSGEYQIFAVSDDLKMKLLSDTRVMGTRPSYGRIATP